ncbi:uncharacterized protein JCM15063_001788 [Sporobolomyces koalae]|uniref:uncharacterized protein n=1 Tax=Sporobolomyces koalae TaxID=500713 RepID=UPI0031746AFB
MSTLDQLELIEQRVTTLASTVPLPADRDDHIRAADPAGSFPALLAHALAVPVPLMGSLLGIVAEVPLLPEQVTDRLVTQTLEAVHAVKHTGELSELDCSRLWHLLANLEAALQELERLGGSRSSSPTGSDFEPPSAAQKELGPEPSAARSALMGEYIESDAEQGDEKARLLDLDRNDLGLDVEDPADLGKQALATTTNPASTSRVAKHPKPGPDAVPDVDNDREQLIGNSQAVAPEITRPKRNPVVKKKVQPAMPQPRRKGSRVNELDSDEEAEDLVSDSTSAKLKPRAKVKTHDRKKETAIKQDDSEPSESDDDYLLDDDQLAYFARKNEREQAERKKSRSKIKKPTRSDPKNKRGGPVKNRDSRAYDSDESCDNDSAGNERNDIWAKKRSRHQNRSLQEAGPSNGSKSTTKKSTRSSTSAPSRSSRGKPRRTPSILSSSEAEESKPSVAKRLKTSSGRAARPVLHPQDPNATRHSRRLQQVVPKEEDLAERVFKLRQVVYITCFKMVRSWPAIVMRVSPEIDSLWLAPLPGIQFCQRAEAAQYSLADENVSLDSQRYFLPAFKPHEMKELDKAEARSRSKDEIRQRFEFVLADPEALPSLESDYEYERSGGKRKKKKKKSQNKKASQELIIPDSEEEEEE